MEKKWKCTRDYFLEVIDQNMTEISFTYKVDLSLGHIVSLCGTVVQHDQSHHSFEISMTELCCNWLKDVRVNRSKFPLYSSVPNRRVGRNKRAGGKILKKH